MNLIRTAMLLAFMTALFMAVGYLIGGSGGMMIAFVVAAGMNLFSYWNADKMVLQMNHAVEVDERTAPEFYGIVRELSARAGLPMPKVYLIDNPQPNAFATGRNPQNAAVAATTGLLERLSYEEVAGVMAHELAHVQNRDTLTMTITATLAGAISMLGNFAFFFGGNRDNHNPLGAIGVIVAMIVAPLAAMLVQMAISRTREYSADRRGAEICGNPLWLASALGQDRPRRQAHPQPRGRAQPGHRASLHHQPALRASAWTICSPPTPTPTTASLRWRRWPASRGDAAAGGAQRGEMPAAPGAASPAGRRAPGREARLGARRRRRRARHPGPAGAADREPAARRGDRRQHAARRR